LQTIVEQFKTQVLAAAAGGTTLRLRGGGSKDWYGQRIEGELLETSAYRGIIAYEPTELVITARCGTPVAEIEAVLAAQGQMLAFEPPHFGAGATIGGVVACGLSGPRRAAAGAVRDFMLGAVLMDGQGQVLTFGGQVMKNVAGYDVSRLLAGSLGTLGLILDVSLKVLPVPVQETSLRFDLSEIEAIRRLNQWAGQPLPISASCWHGGMLTLRLSGAAAAVSEAVRELGGEVVDAAAALDFWRSLREQTHPFFAGGASLWRLSMPSSASAIVLKGEHLIEWGGAQRWLKGRSDADRPDAGACINAGAEAGMKTEADAARNIRSAVAAVGGHATLFRGGAKEVGVFHPLKPAVAAIHRRLKLAFDHAGVFNPGRMY
jgi:glycolate oxidase FAD binding subunit